MTNKQIRELQTTRNNSGKYHLFIQNNRTGSIIANTDIDAYVVGYRQDITDDIAVGENGECGAFDYLAMLEVIRQYVSLRLDKIMVKEPKLAEVYNSVIKKLKKRGLNGQ